MLLVSDSIRFDKIPDSKSGLQNLCSLVLFVSFLLLPTALRANDGDDCIWWYFEGQQRMRDAGVEASFALNVANTMSIDELEFFYTTDSIRFSQTENQRATYHKAVPVDTRSLVLYSGRYERIKLWAVARAGGKTLVAQTAINLYGQSELDKTDFEKLDSSYILPGFDMNQESGSYRATTGEPISFSINSSPSETRIVQVLLDGEKIDELRSEAGVYSYVLPRDRKLNGLSRRDYRDLLFLVDVAGAVDVPGANNADENAANTIDGARYAYYLPLYRSRRDNLDFSGGLAMLFAAMAISLGAVIMKGRRFPWC